MTSQSVVKLFLTEGDKVIVSWFSPLRDQGGYAIAVNYGQRPFSPSLPIVLVHPAVILIYLSNRLTSRSYHLPTRGRDFSSLFLKGSLQHFKISDRRSQ
jgi:Rft protein